MCGVKEKKRLIFIKKSEDFLKNKNKEVLSEKIVQQLRFLPWGFISRAAVYRPLGAEADVQGLQEFFPEKTWLYPSVSGKSSQMKYVSSRRRAVFKKFSGGFFQPAEGPLFSIKKIDLFLVPGVAFDRSGTRLGRGRGFFDRALSGASVQSLKVGIGWSVQTVSSDLPEEKTDIPMDAVVTESWSFYSPQFFKKLKKFSSSKENKNASREEALN